MSYFVVVYDRAEKRLVSVSEFSDAEYGRARDARQQEQLRSLKQGLDREIVLFQADSLEALQRTHGSYFFDERELIDRVRKAAGG